MVNKWPKEENQELHSSLSRVVSSEEAVSILAAHVLPVVAPRDGKHQ